MLSPAQIWSRRSGLGTLLGWNLSLCALICVALECWRPCYFLTDDNLSGYFPTLTEAGRHLKAGGSPFVSDYLFGGHYQELRDISFNNWHPLYMIASLLADTPGRFWIIDCIALPLLLLTTAGFTILAHHLREEYALRITDGYLAFYTLSFVFSTYVLTIGPSWISFLTSQSCLPWFALALLQKSPIRGTALVAIVAVHEILAGFSGLTVSSGLCFTAFAAVVALHRRSFVPLFSWFAGNFGAALVLSFLLVGNLDGFAHTRRIQGMSLIGFSANAIPAGMFFASFFSGNWTELVDRWEGDPGLVRLTFPCIPTLLACGAAWCVLPAIFSPGRWRWIDKLCFWTAIVLIWFIVRPVGLALVMHQLPLFRSMRWPFRESLLFLFFIHLFLILRFPEKPLKWQSAITIVSILMFALPLPFIRVPTLNSLPLDRQFLFSGKADAYWAKVKATLKPTDEIATVIDFDYWNQHHDFIPYTILGTANFPCYFQVRTISGYTPTVPVDAMPVNLVPSLWFGAYGTDQVDTILAARPKLKILRVESVQPLKVTLSTGNGPPVDISSYLAP